MNDVDQQFWNTVTEPIKPEEVTEGTLIYMETKERGKFYKTIDEIWVDGHGIRQARLRDPRPEELAGVEAGTVQALVWVEKS